MASPRTRDARRGDPLASRFESEDFPADGRPRRRRRPREDRKPRRDLDARWDDGPRTRRLRELDFELDDDPWDDDEDDD